MPAVSQAQQRLFAAAEHGADFPAAQRLRESMSHDKLREFAVGSMKDKPEHVKSSAHKDALLKMLK